MITHPLERLGSRAFTTFFAVSVIATLVAMAVMLYMARGFQVKPDGAKSAYDIIAFELARTPAQATLILDDWGVQGVAAARTQTRADFLFILCYVSSLSAACIWVVRRFASSRAFLLDIGRWFAWGMLLAGGCDVIENTALLHVLDGAVAALYTQTAFWCATVKFLCVALALVYFLGGAVGVIFRLDRPNRE